MNIDLQEGSFFLTIHLVLHAAALVILMLVVLLLLAATVHSQVRKRLADGK